MEFRPLAAPHGNTLVGRLARERALSVRVLPTDLLPAGEEEPAEDAAAPDAPPGAAGDVLECARTLGIPWERILQEEIEAELRLRRYLPNLGRDCPLLPAARILSYSVFRSWRLRDQIESLACEARSASSRRALRTLRIVFRRLTGKGDGARPEGASDLWFAYQRVLLLLRVCRAAARTRGPLEERLARVCTAARCGYDDAAWAIESEDSAGRGHRLDAAVRKVRDEGFPIPRAESEARALAELRRMIRRRPRPRARNPRPLSDPRRVRVPLDAF